MIDMNGRVCMVTGATDGIGKVTARELGRNGATVIILARSEKKARSTVEEITAETGNNRVDYVIADLSSLRDVHRAAEAFKAKYDRLHVLVNNAARFTAVRRTSVEGYEMMFAVNHLAPFLLTYLLLDTISASGTPGRKARIISVTSKMHFQVQMDFDDLQAENQFKPMAVYARSKLANLLFTYELARRLQEEDAPVTVNAAHPGFVNTGIGKDPDSLRGCLYRIGLFFVRWMQVDPEKGAQTSLYLATAPEVENLTGKYFEKSKVTASSDASMIATDWTRLWEISEELTGLS